MAVYKERFVLTICLYALASGVSGKPQKPPQTYVISQELSPPSPDARQFWQQRPPNLQPVDGPVAPTYNPEGPRAIEDFATQYNPQDPQVFQEYVRTVYNPQGPQGPQIVEDYISRSSRSPEAQRSPPQQAFQDYVARPAMQYPQIGQQAGQTASRQFSREFDQVSTYLQPPSQ